MNTITRVILSFIGVSLCTSSGLMFDLTSLDATASAVGFFGIIISVAALVAE